MDMERVINAYIILSLVGCLFFIIGIAIVMIVVTLSGERKERKRADSAEARADDAERSRYKEGQAATRIRVALETELSRLGGGHYTVLDPRRLEDILLCRPKKIHVLLHSRKGSGRAAVLISEYGEVEGIVHSNSSSLFSVAESIAKPIQEVVVQGIESTTPLPSPFSESITQKDEEDIRREIEERVKNALARGQKTVSYMMAGNLSDHVRSDIKRSLSEFGKAYLYGNRIRVIFSTTHEDQ